MFRLHHAGGHEANCDFCAIAEKLSEYEADIAARDAALRKARAQRGDVIEEFALAKTDWLKERDRLRAALDVAANRFADLACIIERSDVHDSARNAGYCRKSAQSCHEALARSQPATPSPVQSLNPCQRPAQCVDDGFGPEKCQLCNPSASPTQTSAGDVDWDHRAYNIVDKFPVQEEFDAKACLIDEVAAALSAARAEGEREGLERAARLAETYSNGQFTDKDTWAEGFGFAKRMIAQNLRALLPPAPETK